MSLSLLVCLLLLRAVFSSDSSSMQNGLSLLPQSKTVVCSESFFSALSFLLGLVAMFGLLFLAELLLLLVARWRLLLLWRVVRGRCW